MTEALGGVSTGKVRLNGEKLTSKVQNAITGANVRRTIDGASTFTLTLQDAQRVLLGSRIFNSRVTTQVGKHSFELAQIKKQQDSVILVFEDLAVAALRRKNKPRKVEGGTMTREQFARLLVDEVKWIKFRGPKTPQDRAKVEMARGKTKEGGGEKGENSWDATGRLAEEVNWLRFVVGKQFFFLPETELFKEEPSHRLAEGRKGVDNIDFDWDIGKPVATVTVQCRAERWEIPPGETARIPEGLGPIDGKWLVADIDRNLYFTTATITLKKPEPALPEPKPPSGDADLDAEGTGSGPTVGGGSGDYIWPVNGQVSSEYGPRGNSYHYGIDISAPLGTPIVASREGTVIFAGAASGYGTAVYISHDGGEVITRYGHMSVIRCQRGQQVDQGERIADVGQEGNSTGPHVHFEYRPGDSPRNPREVL